MIIPPSGNGHDYGNIDDGVENVDDEDDKVNDEDDIKL